MTLTEPGEHCCTKGLGGGGYFRCLLRRGGAGPFITADVTLTPNSIK